MEDLILRGFKFNVVPLGEEGGEEGKQINIFLTASDKIVRLPLDAGSVNYLMEHLDMDNEALQIICDKAEADRAAEIALNGKQ